MLSNNYRKRGADFETLAASPVVCRSGGFLRHAHRSVERTFIYRQLCSMAHFPILKKPLAACWAVIRDFVNPDLRYHY